MAITVQQSPTYFNIANNHLVYVVTSDQTSQPQYQFVLDIKDTDGNLIQRLKQQPNPSNKGVFDIGQLIAQQFDGGIIPLNIVESLGEPGTFPSPITNQYRSGSNSMPASVTENYPFLNGGAANQYDVFIGEEYGTSTTSIVTLYNGEGVAGDPSVSPTKEWQIYSNGVLDTTTRYPTWAPSWNLVSKFDTYYDSTTLFGTIPNVYYKKGEGKWVPQRWYGVNNFSNYTEWDTTNPSQPLYSFNVGLTDFPVTRSVMWDDYLTLSIFQGTEYAPDKLDTIAPQSGSLYMPNQQWVGEVKVDYTRADGPGGNQSFYGNTALSRRINSGSSVVGDNQDPLVWMYSQSIDDTMTHFGVGPMNFGFRDADGTDTQFRNPVDNPTNYTTAYTVELRGAINANASSYSNMRIAGRERTGFLTPEIGSYAYTLPLTILSDSGNPTGSYDVPTAEFTIRANTGGECIARINYADLIYTPESPFPAASVLAQQDCINRDMIASGSSARAYLTEAEQWEIDLIEPNFKEAHDEKYWKWKLVISNEPGRTSGGYIMVLDSESNPSADHLGVKLVGGSSCTGAATGLFTGQNGGSTYTSTLGGVAGPSYVSSGSEFFYSTFDKRTYIVDWSGYPGHYKDCGYEKKQFYWQNKYGAFDFFTFTKAETITDDIERKDYKQTFVDFASNSNTIDYNTSRRGTKQFQNTPTQRHRVESNWLTQEEADAVREMFFSTNVYYMDKQISSEISYKFKDASSGDVNDKNLNNQKMGLSTLTPFDQVNEIPVVITNASITEKTNPRTDKLYRYTVEYQLANDLRPRV